MTNIFLNPGRDHWPSLLKRPSSNQGELEEIVSEILADVKESGDKALSKYTLKFDRVKPNHGKFLRKRLATQKMKSASH